MLFNNFKPFLMHVIWPPFKPSVLRTSSEESFSISGVSSWYEAGACALKQSITTSRGSLYPLGITPILLILLPRDIKKGYATGFRQLKEECLHSLKKELKQGQVKEK